ncbi:MAG TPA: hypothetical protein VFW38_03490 [Solirubrobacteraceae bacterium]|nr:hypothetical protein [Solirubrobacteraceae bacterium]
MSTAAQTRTYRGRTVEELVPTIERELGPDAIIVRRREGLHGGILGFFQRSFVEVEAVAGRPRLDVYDELPDEPPYEPPASLSSPSSPLPSPPPSEPPAASAHESVRLGALTPQGAYVSEQLAALAAAAGEATAVATALAPAQPSFAVELAAAQSEPQRQPRVSAVPAFEAAPVAQATAVPVVPEQAAAAAVVPVPHATAMPVAHVPTHSHPAAAAGLARTLQRVGVSEAFAHELIGAAQAHVLPLAPREGLTRATRTALAQRIPVARALPVDGACFLVLGAGGSGKTTYCAALLGVYRRAGILRATYATLTWHPERPGLHAILSPDLLTPTPVDSPRVQAALRRARERGLLVIDTPRASPADRAGVRALAKVVSKLEPERVLLALPATLGAAAAAQQLQALRPLGANAVALTHAGETDQLGVAVEAACRFGLAPEHRLDPRRGGGWRIARMDPASIAQGLLP